MEKISSCTSSELDLFAEQQYQNMIREGDWGYYAADLKINNQLLIKSSLFEDENEELKFKFINSSLVNELKQQHLEKAKIARLKFKNKTIHNTDDIKKQFEE